MKKIITRLFENKTLTRQEAMQTLLNISEGKYTEIEIASFITAFCMRNITVEELQGFRDALLQEALKLDFKGYDLIDLCGTGGDGKDTFNISTLASFVVAGAGYKVAKHGNYGVSSGCGSSNVMEYLGYSFTNEESKLKSNLDKAGICFIHAPLFNPAMKIVAPIRKTLGVKTFFNMLGPLVNPANPEFQVMGVFNLELARLYAYLYQETNKKYTILHALDGYDEISLTSTVKIYNNEGESMLDLFELGFQQLTKDAIKGGESIQSSAKIFTDVLSLNGTDAQNEVVLCNAALAIKTIKSNQTFSDCFYEAEASLLSKSALKSFNLLLEN